ncbi:MAG TPA: NYN domain-containing protein [Clostridiaceae bacterium]|nr:NYN domain-containing protein [Clostridiaceae bacterium]
MSNFNVLNDVRMAVLIDADNISYEYLDALMSEVARYGLPTIKRIYGDWTSPNLNGWKPLLQEYAIIPIQQFSYTTGKNSTDSALIIDAMDLLYTEKVDAFCLVSSDSDFTRLAMRLREEGRKVYGFGEQKTPKAFIAACDKFIYLEVLNTEDEKEDDEDHREDDQRRQSDRTGDRKERGNKDRKQRRGEAGGQNNGRGSSNKKNLNMDRKTKRLIARCIDDVADEDGWANLGDVGNLIINIRPDFDPRNYGCTKLSNVMRKLPNVEVTYRNINQPGGKQIYIRNIN